MNKSVFMDKNEKPTEITLSERLSQSYRFFQSLSALTKDFIAEWNFSKSSGWVQKVADRKKALYYLIPLEKAFQIGLTLREHERETLLLNPNVEFAHQSMTTAKKYSEGFFIQFLVSDEQSFFHCETFIKEIITLR